MSAIINMKLTRKKVYNRCFCLLSCVLLMVSSVQVFVLCRGQDGHSAIEAVGNDCCAKLPTGVSREASLTSAERALSSNKSSCGPCMDIPVGLVGVFKKPNQVSPVFLASTTIGRVTISNCDSSEYQLALESFTPTPYFTPLRSIILLI